MATPSYDPLGGYNTDPAYQAGAGAYGKVPGSIDIPPNIYQQIGTIDPLLGEQTGTANQSILSELHGDLSNETLAALQQNAAQFGVKSGMPRSQFAGYYGMSGLKDTREARQQQGLQDYLAMLKGTGATLTPQQLAAEIASRNAAMRAAPDPKAAADQQMADWQSKFQAAAGGPTPGANGGGGYRVTPSPAGGGSLAASTPAGYPNNWPSSGGGGGTGPFNDYALQNRNLGTGNPWGNTYGNVSPTDGSQLSPEAQFVQNELGINPAQWDQETLAQIAAMNGFTNSGYQPTSHGTMYMGANPENSGSYQFVQQQLGIDPSTMDQQTLDQLASMYGYDQSPAGSTGSMDLGGTQSNGYDFGGYGSGGYDTGGYDSGYGDTGGGSGVDWASLGFE